MDVSPLVDSFLQEGMFGSASLLSAERKTKEYKKMRNKKKSPDSAPFWIWANSQEQLYCPAKVCLLFPGLVQPRHSSQLSPTRFLW